MTKDYRAELNLSNKIINKRNKLGYSQEELAELSGVSVRTIQRVEKGKVTPRGFTMRAILNALDIQLDEIEVPFSKIQTLNSFGILIIFFPVISLIIQCIYWYKNKQFFLRRNESKKIISFQLLWLVAVLLSMIFIHVFTLLFTGQSVYGKFPIRLIAYLVLIAINYYVILKTSIDLRKEKTDFLDFIPTLW